MRMRSIYITIILAIAYALPAFAVSTLTLTPSGEGVFLLQGVGIEDAGAFDITIYYDAATLANPRVDQGSLISGAMLAVNPNTPGMLRMAIIRTTPIRGSGIIAKITFDRKGSAPGKINTLNAHLVNIDGKPLPAVVQVTNPTDASSDASSASQDTASSPAATPSSGSGVPVSRTNPPPAIIIAGQPDTIGEKVSSDEKAAQSADPNAIREPVKEPVVIAGKADRPPDAIANVPEKKVYKQKSILDRFREYKGERTAKALILLFEQDGMIGFRQEPPVALSTGKDRVKAVFITTAGSKSSSDMAVMGARLISLKSDPEYTNTWIAELEPVKGEYSASISVPQDRVIMVYPLTIAPKIDVDMDRSGKVTEEYFTLFLQGPAGKNLKGFDVNGDGKRDYIDDYIFTANYIRASKNAKTSIGVGK